MIQNLASVPPNSEWIFSFIFGTKDKYLISLTNTLRKDRQSTLTCFKVWQIAIIHDNFYLIFADLLVEEGKCSVCSEAWN